MERSILKEMTEKRLKTYLHENQFKLNYYRNFFPLQYSTLLTWEAIQGRKGATIMADTIAYNASAPLKTRQTIAKASGDIPKTAIKRKMDEKDFNEYIRLTTQSEPQHNAILDYVFNDVDFCYNGVEARLEFLALQALSLGELSLNRNNNNGLITETKVKFGIPESNKTPVNKSWDTTDADPLKDIKDVVKKARDKGVALKEIITDEVTLNRLLESDKIKGLFNFNSKGVKITPTLEIVNNYLQAHRLPTIKVINQALTFENENHERSVIRPFKEGYLTFLTDLKVGNMLHGPIAEESVDIKQAIRVKKGHVLVTKFSELEPFAEFTKAQANAFPVFNDPDNIFMLNTMSETDFIK